MVILEVHHFFSSEAPSVGKQTSVQTLSPGTFMEVSPPSLHFDSGPLGFSVPTWGLVSVWIDHLHSHQYYHVKIDFQLALFHPQLPFVL
jgi:hypothetical protein